MFSIVRAIKQLELPCYPYASSSSLTSLTEEKKVDRKGRTTPTHAIFTYTIFEKNVKFPLKKFRRKGRGRRLHVQNVKVKTTLYVYVHKKIETNDRISHKANLDIGERVSDFPDVKKA